jgi:hypothetical protein
VLAKYEGWPFKVVHGYPGFNEVLIATERGEVDGLFTAGQISRPDMVSSGFLIPVLQSMAEHPGVPLMSDAVSDSNARALLGLLLAPSRIGLPLMGPPNIPAERLALLRRSYLEMTADKDFQDESENNRIEALAISFLNSYLAKLDLGLARCSGPAQASKLRRRPDCGALIASTMRNAGTRRSDI